jgi:hypothetical protein
MAKKPIINNGLKGDTKLKQILPEYDRPVPSSMKLRKCRSRRPEEVMAETDEDFRIKKEVRKDEIRPGAKFRRKRAVAEYVHPPESDGTSIIKLIAIVIGILILISSMAIAIQNQDEEPAPEVEAINKDGYQFLENLLICQELSYSNPAERGVFSAFKVQYVTGEELELSLDSDYDFYIEIIDKSGYDIKYSRSAVQGTAITNVEPNQVPQIINPDEELPYNLYDTNDSEVFLMNSFVNIKVTDAEIHSAALMVMIWK